MPESNPTTGGRLALDADAVAKAIDGLTASISKRFPERQSLGLIGLPTRGVPLARRLAAMLGGDGSPAPVGQMDITFHRDDVSLRLTAPSLTDVPFDVTGKTIILVDDVVFTGRSTRAALDALNDLGRPERILLAALIDRGHRRLPIHADFIGASVKTKFEETVRVSLQEVDGRDAVEVIKP